MPLGQPVAKPRRTTTLPVGSRGRTFAFLVAEGPWRPETAPALDPVPPAKTAKMVVNLLTRGQPAEPTTARSPLAFAWNGRLGDGCRPCTWTAGEGRPHA